MACLPCGVTVAEESLHAARKPYTTAHLVLYGDHAFELRSGSKTSADFQLRLPMKNKVD
jgi:hypothetical protein